MMLQPTLSYWDCDADGGVDGGADNAGDMPPVAEASAFEAERLKRLRLHAEA